MDDVPVIPDTLTAVIAAVGSVDEGDSTVHTVAVGGTATGAITYAWSVAGDGTIVGSASGASVTVEADEVGAGDGDYTVSVDITRAGLNADDSEEVTVNDVPIPVTLTAVIAAVGTVDEGDETVHTVSVGGTAVGDITYDWSVVGDGSIVGSSAGSTCRVRADQVGADGAYTVSVDITRQGIAADDSEAVNVNDVPVPDTLTAAIAAVGSVDEGTETEHTVAVGGTAEGTITYAWSVTGDGTIVGPASGASVMVEADEVDAAGGDYTVSVDVGRAGLSAQDSEAVDVDDVPVLPSIISGLVAMSGEDREVPLSWIDPDDSSLTAIRYRVKESSSTRMGCLDEYAEYRLAIHSYTVTDLTNETSYDFQVAAVNPSAKDRTAQVYPPRHERS